MSHEFDRQRAEAIIQGLRATQRRLGFVPPAHVDVASEELSRSRSTIYRWVKDGLPGARRPAQLTRAEKVVLFDHYGVTGAAWEDLRKLGETSKSRATFYRAAADVPHVERLYAAEGLPGVRRAQLRLERREEREGLVLIADHLLADVEVVLPGKGAKRVRPWITAFQAVRSRSIAGIGVSVRPTRAAVLAGLGEAMRRTPELSPAYGLPTMIRTDNGREFLAKALRSAAVELGFTHVPLRRRSPWLNGKIERWHQTVELELFSQMPYYTKGPRREDGTLDIPADVQPLPIEIFVALLRAWVWTYNFERAHGALDQRTPARAWADDEGEVEEVPEESLRRYLLEAPRGQRKVEPRGVFYKRGWYLHADLQDLVGRMVSLRVMPHDDMWVDVYDGDRYVCRAVRQGEASPREREKILEARADAARRAAGISRSAKRRAKARWAAMHGSEGPRQVNSIPADDKTVKRYGQLDHMRKLGHGRRLGRKREDA